jgi:glycosyltransferase involved in cell wall biosynthesis
MIELKNKPLFSIIIPTYNHGHLIKRCLDSVITQTYQDWEVIIINNYSDDNTIELVEGYRDSRIKLINYRNNGIIGASRNVGIKNAAGDWICFLDSDDWWYPEKLKICSNYINKYNFIYHDLDVYKNGRQILKRKVGSRKLKGNIFLDLLVNGNAISNSSVVVNKNILLKINGISEDRELILVEDYDCWLKISKIDNKFCFIPKSLGAYWIGNNASAASERAINADMFVFNKYINLLNEEERKLANINLSYRLGRFYYGMKKFDSAIFNFKIAIRNKLLKRKIQCVKYIVFSYFNFI